MRTPEPVRWIDAGSEVPETLRTALRAARADAPSTQLLKRVEAGVRAQGLGPRTWPFESAKLPLASSLAFLLALAAGASVQRRSQRQGQTAQQVAQPSVQAQPARSTRLELAPPAAGSSEPLDSKRRSSAHKPQPSHQNPTRPKTDEIALLRAAHRMLAVDPKRARAILQQHARDYPNGDFVEEREALSVEALLRAGMPEEARAHAKRFVLRYPRSPYLRRVHACLDGQLD